MNTVLATAAQAAIPELPATARRVLVVFNPAAGRGKQRLEDILQALRDYGCVVNLLKTTGPGDAGRIAEREGPGYDILAVAGGDGTINEVVNGLAKLDAAPVLAVIPFGTANVVAWEIGLGTDPARVARTIAEGYPVEVHPGVVNGRYFVLMTGIGFDATVVAGVSSKLKHALGKLAYVWRSLVEFFRYDYPTLTVTIDGVAHQVASAVIAKGHFYGGTFICAPEAKLTERSFEVCLFLRGGTWHAMRYAIWLTLGRLGRLPTVRVIRGEKVDLDGPAGAPIQGDGEVVSHLPATVRLSDRTLRLLYPCDSAVAG